MLELSSNKRAARRRDRRVRPAQPPLSNDAPAGVGRLPRLPSSKAVQAALRAGVESGINFLLVGSGIERGDHHATNNGKPVDDRDGLSRIHFVVRFLFSIFSSGELHPARRPPGAVPRWGNTLGVTFIAQARDGAFASDLNTHKPCQKLSTKNPLISRYLRQRPP